MIDEAQATALVARYPHCLDTIPGEPGVLADTESGAERRCQTVREAIGWVNAGEWDSDGTNPRSTRLAAWFRNRGD